MFSPQLVDVSSGRGNPTIPAVGDQRTLFTDAGIDAGHREQLRLKRTRHPVVSTEGRFRNASAVLF
jgi:hypothetical protein